MREEVPEEYLLWAFRYCINRLSYAHADAHLIILKYWPVLRQWKDSIVSDLERNRDYLLQTAAYQDLGEMCQNTLIWIGEQEAMAELARTTQDLGLYGSVEDQ